MANISISGKRTRGKPGTIDTLPEELKERIILAGFVADDMQWFIDRYEQLQMLLTEKDQRILNIKAWFGRKITVIQTIDPITAAHLTTKTVTDDTLITKGDPIDFMWDDPRFQDRSINVNPGTGVQPWEHIWSWKAHARRAVQPVVNEVTGEVDSWRKGEGFVTQVYEEPTYLQRIEWQQIGGIWKLWPKAWILGSVVDLTQDIVVEKGVLEP